MVYSSVRTMFNELPKCRKCADHGYVTIMYPKGYNTIKICDCTAAHERWGEATFDEIYDRPESYTGMTCGCISAETTRPRHRRS